MISREKQNKLEVNLGNFIEHMKSIGTEPEAPRWEAIL